MTTGSSTQGIQIRTRQRWLGEAVELVSSMRFAISLLTLIAIASVIGTAYVRYLTFADPYLLISPVITIEIVLFATVGGLGRALAAGARVDVGRGHGVARAGDVDGGPDRGPAGGRLGVLAPFLDLVGSVELGGIERAGSVEPALEPGPNSLCAGASPPTRCSRTSGRAARMRGRISFASHSAASTFGGCR